MIPESGAKHMAVKMDVTVLADLQAVLDKIHKTYGKTVELAVDSAGWMEGESPLMDMKERDWDRCIAVHLKVRAFIVIFNAEERNFQPRFSKI